MKLEHQVLSELDSWRDVAFLLRSTEADHMELYHVLSNLRETGVVETKKVIIPNQNPNRSAYSELVYRRA